MIIKDMSGKRGTKVINIILGEFQLKFKCGQKSKVLPIERAKSHTHIRDRYGILERIFISRVSD